MKDNTKKPNIIPIRIKVSKTLIEKSKQHIKKLYRSGNKKNIKNPDSWKGIAAEFICSDALKEAYPKAMEIEAAGISSSKDYEFDIQMAGIKMDIKCGTSPKYYTICPIVQNVKEYKDTIIYIGCRYIGNGGNNDIVEIYGSMHRDEVMNQEIKSYYRPEYPFYEVYLGDMNPGILKRLKSNI